MVSRRRIILYAALLCAGPMTFAPRDAIADVGSAERAAARALFDQGRELMAAGNTNDACVRFEESRRIVQFGGTLLNLADCYEKQGRLATAWHTFLSAAAVSKNDGNAEREAEARRRAAALEPEVPKLVITVKVQPDLSSVVIRRDGAVVGVGQWGVEIPVDPGLHAISATAPGHAPWETTVEVRPERLEAVEVPILIEEPRNRAVPTPPNRAATVRAAPRRPSASAGNSAPTAMTLASGVLGLAGIATGSVFGLVSMSQHKSADAHCDGGACRDTEGERLRNDARLSGNVSSVAFIVGAAGVAGCITLWLTAPKNDSLPSGTQLSLMPSAVMLSRHW